MAKRKSQGEKVDSAKNHGTLSNIVAELKQYTDIHPEAIEETKRIINTDKGAEAVKHIPIHKVVQILDAVVVHGNGGTWDTELLKMEFAIDNVVTAINLCITDAHQKVSKRMGIGAANIYGRDGRRMSSDAVDNAAKMAMASAIKKASSQFGLGISMWEKDAEPFVAPEQKIAIPDGQAKLGSEIRKTEVPKTATLPEELQAQIRATQDKHKLTNDEVLTILKTHDKTKDSNGDTMWLVTGNPKDKVKLFIEAIEESMK